MSKKKGKTTEKKDLLYLHAKTKEKAHKAIKRPGRPFTLRDHVMMLKTEKMLLNKKHSIYSFMKAGLAMLVIGLLLITILRGNIIFEIIGWIIIVVGFLEILESYHRMDRWKKEMARLRRKYK